MSNIQVRVEINHRALLKYLIVVVAVLLSLGVVVAFILTYTSYKNLGGFIPLFDLDGEGNLPSYLSSLNLTLAALILWSIAQARKAEKSKYWLHWHGLAIGFFLMGIDESASLHEKLAFLIDEYMNIHVDIRFIISTIGFLVAIYVIYNYYIFLMHLPAKSRRQFIFSGIIFVLGAFGAEGVGGYFYSHTGQFGAGYGYAEVVVEESLEMIGILLFIKYLFDYIDEDPSSNGLVIKIT